MKQANTTALRAIEILSAFDDDKSVWSLNEMAERFGMTRSTAYRYLASLRESGFLESDSTGRYRLGVKILALARVARKGITILEVAEPHLRRLQEQTGETILLSRRTGKAITVVECLESRHAMRITFARGHVLPNPATATAKVLLAYAPEDELHELLRRQDFAKYTDRTITDAESIRQHLIAVRSSGYAVNDGEVDEGVRSVAAPIFNARREVVYSVGVVGPMVRMIDERMAEIATSVRSCAGAIGAEWRVVE